jgi:hypothetical protein
MALLIAFVSVTANAAEPPDRLLQAEIESLAAKLTDGVATLDHADTYFGAKGTPQSDEVVVLFAMTSWAGGNGSRQFMAVLGRDDASNQVPNGRRARRYQLLGLVAVGSDSDRWFKHVELRGDRVMLSGGRWLKGDAHCCPSGDARAVYQISERGLNEVTR